jgi:hypothetical protein
MSGPRSELGSLLRAAAPAGVNVYDEPPRQLVPPALVVKPGVPYRRPQAGCTDDYYRLDVWAMVGRELKTPAEALDGLIALVSGTVQTWPEGSWLGASGSLVHEETAGVKVLAAICEVGVRT